MPNWCQNTILFNGPTEELSKLIETVEGPNTSLSLRKIISTPEELVTSSAPNRNEDDTARFLTLYGAADWYDFQIKNWGTKWDVQAQIIYDSKASAIGYQTYTENKYYQENADTLYEGRAGRSFVVNALSRFVDGVATNGGFAPARV